MQQGTIVLLNGTSSAGKTSIAKALQEIMETPYVHTGIDHFLPRVPSRCFAVADASAASPSEYFLQIYRDGADRTVIDREGGEAAYGSGILTEVRIGSKGVALLAGMYYGIAALAKAGVDVIVDDVIYDRRVLDAAVNALHGSQILFVGLHVPRDVAERRERERGDRGPGGALAFYDLVHAHGVYDLELDTSVLSAMECALRIKQTLHHGSSGHAFADLAQRLAT